ncbi:MAG: trehalose-6-phosphate synthase [Rhizobiales bacterium]|nr:trehalose-6-phosphate synthase [Hyphomicrobiales bacterium]
MAKLVVVSNRVSLPSRSGSRAGGLEVALRAVFRDHPGIWFGWSGRVVPHQSIETRTIAANNQQFVVTDLTEEDHSEYYNGFANRVLWPILHYRLDLAEYTLRDLTGYLRVNEHFADELHKVLAPDDLVWVHDYHLIPLAKALRDRGHQNKIGFFLHTPLPPMEILTAIPNHERLFPTLCHYDLVGFQTETDGTNFARYLICECKLPSRDLQTFLANGRSVQLGVFPVGVAVDEIIQWAERGAESSLVRRVVNSLSGRAMLIGVDRLDYSKGIVARLESFERFLLEKPDWQGRITFLQIAPRSRFKIREYAEIEAMVSATAGRINGRFGQPDWTPIRYVNQSHSRRTLAGLYRCARAGLVTPLRDGMNLVAKEYVAAQNPDDPGVLILSRFAGAARECTGALLVNPYDTDTAAEAIAHALTMSQAERRDRYQATIRNLRLNDIADWGKKFLTQLCDTNAELSLFSRLPVTAAPPGRPAEDARSAAFPDDGRSAGTRARRYSAS